MMFFKMTSLVIVLSICVYTYLMKFNALVIIASVVVLIVMWTVILLRKKYLQVMIKKTQASLQEKLLSSEADAK